MGCFKCLLVIRFGHWTCYTLTLAQYLKGVKLLNADYQYIGEQEVRHEQATVIKRGKVEKPKALPTKKFSTLTSLGLLQLKRTVS